MKTVPINLKKIIDVVDKEVMKKTTKKTVYSKLNTKVNNLEKKIPDVTNLIHVNQNNTDKTITEKNLLIDIVITKIVDKKCQTLVDW